MFHGDLKNRLRDRIPKLRLAGSGRYSHECRYFMEFLQSDKYIKCLLAELDASASVDFFKWWFGNDVPNPSWPKTEEGRAKVCHGILNNCVKQDSDRGYFYWGRKLGRHTNGELHFGQFTDGIIKPLVDYLSDRIDDGGNVLYLLIRFKMKCEWFHQKELYDKYSDCTSRGESILVSALRESLFGWGIDFPFSRPESPSGKADVVAWLGTNDPLVLEAKVFNPNRSQRIWNLQQGFHQVFSYAHNYNESVGYLVIFNCHENELVIAPDSETEPEYPHRIEFGGKTFFVVVINLNPDRKPASKEDPSSRLTVSHSELTKAITNPTGFEASAGGVLPVV